MSKFGCVRVVLAGAISAVMSTALASVCFAENLEDYCRAVETPINGKDLRAPQWPAGSGVRAGWVIFELYVATDGRAREPRVLHASPAGVFDDAATLALLHSEYSPASRNGQAVGRWWRFSYLFHTAGYGLSQVTDFEKNVRRTAKNGVASSEYLHSLIVELGGLRPPKAERDPVAAREWMIKAAEHGWAPAQYLLAHQLLGSSCTDRRTEGLAWLEAAARSGYLSAQVELARENPSGPDGAPSTPALAAKWLEAKPPRRDSATGRELAEALIVSGTDVEGAALPIIAELIQRQGYLPSVHELRAAALARLGRFDQAIVDHEKALTMARELKWNTGPQDERLQAYRAGSAWTRAILLPSDSPVPVVN